MGLPTVCQYPRQSVIEDGRISFQAAHSALVGVAHPVEAAVKHWKGRGRFEFVSAHDAVDHR